MPAILPALIFLGGSVLIPVLSGRVRQVYLLALGLFGMANVFMLKMQTSWMAEYMGFKVIFLHADRISLYVGYIFVFIGFLAILYSIHVNETWHQMLALWYVGASLGAVFSGDLLSFYLWWEIMAVASAGLIFLKNSDASRRAGYRYLLMHLIGGAILIGGIFLHFMNTGSLLIEPMAGGWAFNLVLIGVGMNAAFVLLHTWLPDAYPSAPITASVFMSVYTTKTAVYALIRLAPGWDFVAYMGAAMAVFGVTMALIQSNPRKLLSYHIISQVGYMVAAIGLGGAIGIDGGIMHLFNHILYKALLFMTIGAVIYRTGKDNLTEMGGVARLMPFTTAAAIIASLSIAGAPLFNGFISKALIFQAAESNVIIELMLELAAVGTFLSFFKFTYFGFLRPNKDNAHVKEAPLHMTLAMGGAAVLCVAIGVAPQLFVPLLPFALTAAETSFYIFPRVIGTLQIMVVSGILFFGAIKVFSPHRRETFDFDWLYGQAGRGLQQVAAAFSWTNNTAERGTQYVAPALLALRQPIAKVNALLTRLLFALSVDIWLFRPVTPSVTEAEEKKNTDSDKYNEDIATAGEISHFEGGTGLKLVDAAIGQVAKIGDYLSHFSGAFDRIVIDGFVNGIAWVTAQAGRRLRPIQTGDVQNYGMVMVGGAFVIMMFVAMAFYGVFRLA